MNSTEIRTYSLDDLRTDGSTWFPFGKIDKMKKTDKWIIITNEQGIEAMFMLPKPLQEANLLADGQRIGEELRRNAQRTRNNLVHNAHGDREVFIYARKTRSGKIQFKDYTWSDDMGDAIAWVHDQKQAISGKALRREIAGKRTEFRRKAEDEEKRLQHEMNKKQENVQKMNISLAEIQDKAEKLQAEIRQAELARDRFSTSAIDYINQMKKVDRYYSGQVLQVNREIEEAENKKLNEQLDQMSRSAKALMDAKTASMDAKTKDVKAELAEIEAEIKSRGVRLRGVESGAVVPEQNDNNAALQEEKIRRLEAEAEAAAAREAAANARVEALEAQQRHDRMLAAAKERSNRTQADLDQLKENIAAAQVKEKSESQKKFSADLDELQRRKDELIDTERSILVRGNHPRNELRLRARIDIQDRDRLKVKIVDHVRDNAFAVEFPDFGRTGIVALGIDSKDENDLFMRTCLSENPNWPKVEKEVTGIGGKRREDVDVTQWFEWHDEIEEKLIA